MAKSTYQLGTLSKHTTGGNGYEDLAKRKFVMDRTITQHVRLCFVYLFACFLFFYISEPSSAK